MSRNIIAIIFIIIGLFIDRVVQIGIVWLLLGGILAFLTLFKEKNKNGLTKIVLTLSIVEIISGIIRIILNFT